MLACLIGVSVLMFVLYKVLGVLHARREHQEIQVLTILGARRMTTLEIIDAIDTYHIETNARLFARHHPISGRSPLPTLLTCNLVPEVGWAVKPVLDRLARKGYIRCLNQTPPRWAIADAGKARIAPRVKKDA